MSSKSTPEKFKTAVFCYHPTALALLAFLKKKTSLQLIVLPNNRHGEAIDTIKSFAHSNQVPFLLFPKTNLDKLTAAVKSKKIDLMISFNFPHILNPEIIDLAKIVNVHPGRLPQYRSAHPINWAIICGEKEIFVTIHFLTEKVDGGNIIVSESIKITDADDAATISLKAAKKIPRLMGQALVRLAKPGFKGQKQNPKEARYFPRRKPEDGLIDWSKSAAEINNLVRALVPPWPGAFCYLNQRKIVIDKVKILKKPVLATGEHLYKNGHHYFGTGDLTMKVIESR